MNREKLEKLLDRLSDRDIKNIEASLALCIELSENTDNKDPIRSQIWRQMFIDTLLKFRDNKKIE